MKTVKITYAIDNISSQSEVKTLPQLCDLCRKVGGNFNPTLENQLNMMYVGNYEDFDPEDNIGKLVISVEDKHNGTMSSGFVRTLNELIYTIQNTLKSSRFEFFPPLSKQLADDGGWSESRIEEYREFIEDIQDALPPDHRIVDVESKIDEFLNFWQNKASQSDVTIKTFLDQLIDLKKIVFR